MWRNYIWCGHIDGSTTKIHSCWLTHSLSCIDEEFRLQFRSLESSLKHTHRASTKWKTHSKSDWNISATWAGRIISSVYQKLTLWYQLLTMNSMAFLCKGNFFSLNRTKNSDWSNLSIENTIPILSFFAN